MALCGLHGHSGSAESLTQNSVREEGEQAVPAGAAGQFRPGVKGIVRYGKLQRASKR
jgi:hypothetical protein